MISENQIRYILALKKHKHFQSAAEECFVTQPTLSMQIKKVEEIFGNAIFDRSTSPLSLTSFGKKLIPKLQSIENEYSALNRLIDTKEAFKEEIRIGIIPTIAHYLIPEYYSLWRKKITNADLIIDELKTKDVLQKLNDREIDLGIIAGPLSDNSFQKSILYNERIKVFTTGKETDDVTIDELKEMRPWLLAKGNCLRTQMMNFCNLAEKSDKWKYTGGNMEVLIQMVLKNGGYTLLPEYYEVIQENKKYLKDFRNNDPFRQVLAIYKKEHIKSELMNKIIQEIQSSKSNSFFDGKLGDLLPWE